VYLNKPLPPIPVHGSIIIPDHVSPMCRRPHHDCFIAEADLRQSLARARILEAKVRVLQLDRDQALMSLEFAKKQLHQLKTGSQRGKASVCYG
jgi:hypothetical protein